MNNHNKTQVRILRHYPSNEDYYKLFVGTHLRESIEKEIKKLQHRLEFAKYEAEITFREITMRPDIDGIMNIRETKPNTITIYFNKHDFSKASLKILNHFTHDSIGSMWENKPSHVMAFDILCSDSNLNTVMIKAEMVDEIVEIDDTIAISFVSAFIATSEEIDILADSIINKKSTTYTYKHYPYKTQLKDKINNDKITD